MSAKACVVDDCASPLLAKGLCSRHYQRQRATGSPTGSLHRTLEERFWPKVDRSGECWEWTASKSPDGYGLIRNGRQRSNSYAHRVAYELSVGSIPAGMQVDHICFNPSCVRPEHLRPATQKQNNEHRQMHPRNTSGVRGVSPGWRGKWRAYVGHYGKRHSLGHFPTLEEAEAAVIAKRNELFTHNELDRKAA